MLLQNYEEQKKIFDEMSKKSHSEPIVKITAGNILDTIQNLYKLKHSGEMIRKLYECQEAARKREHEYTDYIHSPVQRVGKKNRSPNKNKSGKFIRLQV